MQITSTLKSVINQDCSNITDETTRMTAHWIAVALTSVPFQCTFTFFILIHIEQSQQHWKPRTIKLQTAQFLTTTTTQPKKKKTHFSTNPIKTTQIKQSPSLKPNKTSKQQTPTSRYRPKNKTHKRKTKETEQNRIKELARMRLDVCGVESRFIGAEKGKPKGSRKE